MASKSKEKAPAIRNPFGSDLTAAPRTPGTNPPAPTENRQPEPKSKSIRNPFAPSSSHQTERESAPKRPDRADEPDLEKISPVIRASIQGKPRASQAEAQRSELNSGLRMAEILEKPRDLRKREAVVSFRCIPDELKRKLDQEADKHNLPVGYLALILFEHGLQSLEGKELTLQPRLTSNGRTLFPNSAKKAGRPLKNVSGKARKPVDTVAFRGVPSEVKQAIARIASQPGMHVPVGEVARALLEYSLQQLKAGRVILPNL